VILDTNDRTKFFPKLRARLRIVSFVFPVLAASALSVLPLQGQIILRTVTPGTDFTPVNAMGLMANVPGGRAFMEKNENIQSFLVTGTLQLPNTGQQTYKLTRLIVHFRTDQYGASLLSVELRGFSDKIWRGEVNTKGDFTARESLKSPINAWNFADTGPTLGGKTTILIGVGFPGGFEGGASKDKFFLSSVVAEFRGTASSSDTRGPGSQTFPRVTPTPATPPAPAGPAPPPKPPLPTNLPDSHGVIYAVTNDNKLLWNRHDGRGDGSVRWADDHGLTVGSGWAFNTIVGAADGVIYGVQDNGDLVWYRHDGHGNGEWKWADSNAKVVNSGFQGAKLATGPDGVLYAQKANGDLLWFRHLGYRDGSDSWGDSRQGKVVATNWHYVHIFSGGAGILYAIDRAGNLIRFLHEGVFDGSSKWMDPAGRQIATGWRYHAAFSSGDGILYALTQDHRLLWFWDQGRHDDIVKWASEEGSVVGTGWDVKTVFSGADLAIPEPPK
jgi:hypothetical protein